MIQRIKLYRSIILFLFLSLLATNESFSQEIETVFQFCDVKKRCTNNRNQCRSPKIKHVCFTNKTEEGKRAIALFRMNSPQYSNTLLYAVNHASMMKRAPRLKAHLSEMAKDLGAKPKVVFQLACLTEGKLVGRFSKGCTFNYKVSFEGSLQGSQFPITVAMKMDDQTELYEVQAKIENSLKNQSRAIASHTGNEKKKGNFQESIREITSQLYED